MTDIELHQHIVMIAALSPLALLLSIWCIEYVSKKVMMAGAWLLGTIGLLVMGRP